MTPAHLAQPAPPSSTVLVDVVVPVATKNRTNQRSHWRSRAEETKKEREATAFALAGKLGRTEMRVFTVGGKPRVASSLVVPPLPCVVTLTRLSERYLDDDGVPAALKAVRDEVALWLGIDDRDPRVSFRYGQEKRKRGCFGVRIVVEAAQGGVL